MPWYLRQGISFLNYSSFFFYSAYREVHALVLAPGNIVLGVRGPEEEGGVGGDVLVDTHLIRARVVRVVLVTPPRRAHASTDVAEGPLCMYVHVCMLCLSLHQVGLMPAQMWPKGRYVCICMYIRLAS